MDIPKTRQYDTGKIEVIARSSIGEALATTELNVIPRKDDYRGVLKNAPRREYRNNTNPPLTLYNTRSDIDAAHNHHTLVAFQTRLKIDLQISATWLREWSTPSNLLTHLFHLTTTTAKNGFAHVDSAW